MHIIDVDKNNIDTEHICCSISEKPGENCVGTKKDWLKERFDDGLVFKKLDVRGKVFIEYIPAEKAWAPINAPNYMYINCFWVSGKYKGQGHANKLLAECIKDAKEKGKDGLVILSSKIKKTFLSDPKFLKYKGFKVGDQAKPYYELLYLPFKEEAGIPKFNECAKNARTNKKGVVIYYSNQCPHTEKYVGLVGDIAIERGVKFEKIKYLSSVQAQNAPAPFTTYSLFFNGEFISNEIYSEKMFLKFLDEIKS
jgi:ribosomal protein S18 acetylase RimI-like enzyme